MGEMDKKRAIKAEIRECIDEMMIVDTHEHLYWLVPETNFEIDLPYFLSRSYPRADLISSGMTDNILIQEKFLAS